MFDTYTSAPNYPQKVTIHEHRATTDESVKLLKEFKKEAEKNIIDSFKFDDNEVRGVLIRSYISGYGTDETLHIKFTLNGQDHYIKETFSRLELSIMTREEFYKKLCKTLADRIAANLTIKIIESNEIKTI